MKIFFNNKYDSLFFIRYLNKNYNIAIVLRNFTLKRIKRRCNYYYQVEFINFSKYNFIIVKSNDIDINKYNFYNKTNKIIWIIFKIKNNIDYYYPSYKISKIVNKINNKFNINYINKIIKKKNLENKLIKVNEFDLEFINY